MGDNGQKMETDGVPNGDAAPTQHTTIPGNQASGIPSVNIYSGAKVFAIWQNQQQCPQVFEEKEGARIAANIQYQQNATDLYNAAAKDTDEKRK